MSDRTDLDTIHAVVTHPLSPSALPFLQERPLHGSRIALLDVLRGLTAPLTHRVRRGEGGLVIVNATLAVRYAQGPAAWAGIAVSALTLLTLYLFNDIVDAEDDQHNAKKDHALAAAYVRHRSLFVGLWLALTGSCVVGAAAIGGAAPYWVAAVAVVNAAYSLVCKKVPLLDIVCVGIWGGAFASIVAPLSAWVGMAAAMAAICHIYQISEDRGVDVANGIATSATLRSGWLIGLQAALAAGLGAAAWSLRPGIAAASLLGVFAYWVMWRQRPNTGWILAKVHFSLIWAYLLYQS